MGYMGFGMRKEDYNRTPKKSFDKIKRIYGEDLNFPRVEGKPNEEISIESRETKRFKHLYQTWAFKITFFTFFVFITGYMVWHFWLFEVLKDRQINEFETTGIISYYNENKSDFLLIKEYLAERSDRVSEIRYDSDMKAYTISFRDKKLTHTVPRDEINYYYYFGLGSPNISNDKIDNEMLVIEDKLFEKNIWIYTFINTKLEQIDKSFIEYIDKSSTNFYIISNLIKNKEIGVIHTKVGISISFNTSNYGQYSIVFTDKVLKDVKLELIDTDSEIKVGQIDNGVYWTKTESAIGPSR